MLNINLCTDCGRNHAQSHYSVVKLNLNCALLIKVKKSLISAMRPYTYVVLGGFENVHMVGVGSVGVTHALCSVI